MQIIIDESSNRSPVEERSRVPFTLKQLKEAIPEHCFQPSTWRSLAYLGLDVGIVTGLYAIANYLDSWFFWPVFWFLQGTMFWALFVVGHDCGHRSFSKHLWVNDFIGHLCHTPILVPFHGWRISHRTHHRNTGNIDTDESWYPIKESTYAQMTWYERMLRFDLPLLFVYPLYLFMRSPDREAGSHFNPYSPLFKPSERRGILISTICWVAMVAFLLFLTYQWGWLWLLKNYLGAYLVFVVWLDLVTFLHHTDADIPWYRGRDWYFLKGALSTIDHDYGFFNPIHHDIGTHVAHHIFLSIPHYHLQTATEAIKPILGSYYRKSKKSIWNAFWNSLRNCYFVPDQGSGVRYQRGDNKGLYSK